MAYTYSIDATVETSKNGNGGTVNLRKTASAKGEVVEKIKSGTKVKVDTLAGNWLPTKHGTKTGYIMAEFIAESDVYKGTSSGGETGGGSVGTGTLTYGKVNKSSGYLNIRKTPSTSGEILGRLYDKDSLRYYDGEEHTGNGYSWYRIEFDGTAYVQARFVVKDTTDDHTVLKDNIFDYDPDAAQEYAWNHTETTVSASNIGYTKPKERSQGKGGDLRSKYDLTLTVVRKQYNGRGLFGKACRTALDTLSCCAPVPAGFTT